MAPAPRERISAILTTERPDGSSLDSLLPVVYDELREMAHRHLRRDRDGQTFSTTDLVHEAYLRLAGSDGITARGRAYFFAAAAQAMRRIMVDEARRRRRLKRGGGRSLVTLDQAHGITDGDTVEVLDLEQGLEVLATLAPRPARVVECRFYGGLSVEDTALALGVTSRTVKRDWAFARAWLYDHLTRDAGASPP